MRVALYTCQGSWTVNCLVRLESESLLELARTARKSFSGLKASNSTIRCNRQIGPVCPSHLRAMERLLEDATTANLWKTLFTLIVELSLRSGLVTEEELISA